MAAENAIDPIHQFEIIPLSSSHVGALTFTNASLFMVIVVATISLIMVYGTSSKALVPGRWEPRYLVSPTRLARFPFGVFMEAMGVSVRRLFHADLLPILAEGLGIGPAKVGP